MANGVTDYFVGTNGTALDAIPSSAWTRHPLYTGGTLSVDGSGGVYSSASGQPFYYNSWQPPTGNQSVKFDIFWTSSVFSAQLTLLARFSPTANTGYILFWNDDGTGSGGTSGLILYKGVAGSFTYLGNPPITFVFNTFYTIELSCIGTTISVLVNGVVVLSVNDSSIATGVVGIGGQANSSSLKAHNYYATTSNIGGHFQTHY